MSRDSSWDLFVCYMWLTRVPLWYFLFTSTYGILLMTFDRYAAVIYPVWYSSKVRRDVTHSLTAALDQLRVVAISTTSGPGLRIGRR